VHSRYFRPNEVDTLLGDYSKAKKKLRWKPQTTFKNLLKQMILSDLEKVRRKEI
jgi:GDPmannose 4,6-dehydratase